MDDFNINFTDLKVDQLGFVFRDIEKQAKIMESTFGFSKFIFGAPSTHTVNFRGRESLITRQLAFSRLGTAQIELIKWIDGNCTYKEYLEQGKEGLHHIAFYVEDSNSYISEFAKNGIRILQSSIIFNLRVTHMDSEKKFGFLIELLEKESRRKRKK
jgi:4-hydroxyphenylpyruvate dioxygenase-like putative hemolysin